MGLMFPPTTQESFAAILSTAKVHFHLGDPGALQQLVCVSEEHSFVWQPKLWQETEALSLIFPMIDLKIS